MRHKVFIRTDAGNQIGLGHLIRCMALAYMLKEEFDITFVCKEIPTQIEKEIKQNLRGLIKIDNEESFFNIISSNDIVVLDGYNFDTDYQKQIKNKGCKLVCIDDLHDKEFVADLIINHAPGVKQQDYKAQPYTQFALGHEYALLRPAFLEQAKKERKIGKTETVLICFGGSDNKNLTESTLKVVSGFQNFKKIIVITGHAYNHLNTLMSLINGDQRIVHHHGADEKQMLALMLETDLAIVPASGTLFEVLTTQTYVISGCYVDNQIDIYKGFLAYNAIIDAKDFENKNLLYAINNIKRYTIKKIIDGESPVRIINKIKKLSDVYSTIG
ncbi:MAG: UDP-2,4-diacetamido-2,4,6-trideoxy-beta-L-altropyranose hydrolase [Bacteroidales bacterium]|nr:UDP-2,4-diacetamido-2,4,6-trideoxy-beta-L-altropyranose hydrolase [Bacteroidales bacterium]